MNLPCIAGKIRYQNPKVYDPLQAIKFNHHVATLNIKTLAIEQQSPPTKHKTYTTFYTSTTNSPNSQHRSREPISLGTSPLHHFTLIYLNSPFSKLLFRLSFLLLSLFLSLKKTITNFVSRQSPPSSPPLGHHNLLLNRQTNKNNNCAQVSNNEGAHPPRAREAGGAAGSSQHHRRHSAILLVLRGLSSLLLLLRPLAARARAHFLRACAPLLKGERERERKEDDEKGVLAKARGAGGGERRADNGVCISFWRPSACVFFRCTHKGERARGTRLVSLTSFLFYFRRSRLYATYTHTHARVRCYVRAVRGDLPCRGSRLSTIESYYYYPPPRVPQRCIESL